MTQNMPYRNDGARFTSESGDTVKHGDVFVPSYDDLTRRRHKLTPVPRHVLAANGDEPEPEEGDGERADTWPPPEWPLSTPPTPYLKRHPTGPHAEMARELLERHGRAVPEKAES